ncbi:MAG TPA: 2-dehydropantoate 2-reductase [Actinomycetota bacterium]|nr:2-dehydropantoate 2-reductase [Actinomycetota bacterium]
MRIAVFGVGGVGGYFGGRLAEAGEDVAFIARGKHLEAMRTHGLHVESINGDFNIDPVNATDDPREVGPVDFVLVGVKAWQLKDAAAAIKPLVGETTTVVPLLNGVEAPSVLAAELGEERVLGGFCAIISFIDGPGRIKHAGYPPFIAFGELDNSPSERAQTLCDAFERAGVNAIIPEDIHAAMWRKFLSITGLSGMGAVLGLPVGAWRDIPETRTLLRSAFQEVFDVATARGVALPEGAVDEAMMNFDSLPDDATASMQRDIQAGRPSELEAQTGTVVRFGAEAGVPTPVSDFIYGVLLPRERSARSQGG